MLLRARTLLPVSSAPVEDAAVLLRQNRVAALGRWRDLAPRAREPAVDLGEVILLPGLINAHCHLDYTDMIGLPPQKEFPDWIKGLLALKAAAGYSDYAQAWLRGAAMLARTGTTTVADIEAVPELLPDVWSSTPLRVVSFLEMTSVRSRPKRGEILREAAARVKGLPPARGGAGLSPHALYSTVPLLLTQTAKLARRRHWRVTTHLAESLAEQEMYLHRRGSLFDWLKNQRDMSDCGRGSPVQQARRCGLLGDNFLAVHANYLDSADIAALAESGSSVAHCPRSHAYFQHAPFSFAKLAAAGVNVCLGTDSLASVLPRGRAKIELNMFAEMRAFAGAYPGVAPRTIVGMATRAGARALGWQDRAGGIFENSLADLIAVPFHGKTEDAWEAVVHDTGDVAVSMIDGQWALAPPVPGAAL
ncbi:MAG: amidohydrolase family protein [Verrucomicrobiota bacterium]|jgi:cytosine/adenosine deaminase-related metal-dependent hydrolase